MRNFAPILDCLRRPFPRQSDKRISDAERAHEAVSRIADNIPLGQPILIGHHSERHARKDAERIENGMRKTVKMWHTAKYWEDRYPFSPFAISVLPGHSNYT